LSTDTGANSYMLKLAAYIQTVYLTITYF
jgi:hypothetical protein